MLTSQFNFHKAQILSFFCRISHQLLHILHLSVLYDRLSPVCRNGSVEITVNFKVFFVLFTYEVLEWLHSTWLQQCDGTSCDQFLNKVRKSQVIQITKNAIFTSKSTTRHATTKYSRHLQCEIYKFIQLWATYFEIISQRIMTCCHMLLCVEVVDV